MGVYGGDVVTVDNSATVALFNTAAVGNGKPVSVTGLGLSGSSATDYQLLQPTGLKGNIVK